MLSLNLDLDLREIDELIIGQRIRLRRLRADGELFKSALRLLDKLEQARKDYVFDRDRLTNALRDNKRNVGNYGK